MTISAAHLLILGLCLVNLLVGVALVFSHAYLSRLLRSLMRRELDAVDDAARLDALTKASAELEARAAVIAEEVKKQAEITALESKERHEKIGEKLDQVLAAKDDAAKVVVLTEDTNAVVHELKDQQS